jgi:hypothetical protein
VDFDRESSTSATTVFATAPTALDTYPAVLARESTTRLSTSFAALHEAGAGTEPARSRITSTFAVTVGLGDRADQD